MLKNKSHSVPSFEVRRNDGIICLPMQKSSTVFNFFGCTKHNSAALAHCWFSKEVMCTMLLGIQINHRYLVVYEFVSVLRFSCASSSFVWVLAWHHNQPLFKSYQFVPASVVVNYVKTRTRTSDRAAQLTVAFYAFNQLPQRDELRESSSV